MCSWVFGSESKDDILSPVRFHLAHSSDKHLLRGAHAIPGTEDTAQKTDPVLEELTLSLITAAATGYPGGLLRAQTLGLGVPVAGLTDPHSNAGGTVPFCRWETEFKKGFCDLSEVAYLERQARHSVLQSFRFWFCPPL